MRRALPLKEAHQLIHIVISQPRIRHVHFVIFPKQRRSDGILFRQHLIGGRNEADKPCVIAHIGHTQQVRTNLVSMANGVACGALAAKNVTPFVADVDSGRLFVTRLVAAACAFWAF